MRQEEGRRRLQRNSMIMWRRDQATLNYHGGITRSWTWGQWRRDRIIASTRRRAVLKTRQTEESTERRDSIMHNTVYAHITACT